MLLGNKLKQFDNNGKELKRVFSTIDTYGYHLQDGLTIIEIKWNMFLK